MVCMALPADSAMTMSVVFRQRALQIREKYRIKSDYFATSSSLIRNHSLLNLRLQKVNDRNRRRSHFSSFLCRCVSCYFSSSLFWAMNSFPKNLLSTVLTASKRRHYCSNPPDSDQSPERATLEMNKMNPGFLTNKLIARHNNVALSGLWTRGCGLLQ
jgi:hypothetical protein